jgi:FkbM family methyltransferase
MKNYSQYDEQTAILAAFGTYPEANLIRGGRFLDIGAYNPFEFSNTRALYECGWSGVMVEPSPGPMASLVREYGNDPRVTLIQAAVGLMEFDSPIPMHVTDDCVSTLKEQEYEKWRHNTKFTGVVLVLVLTLEEIAEQFPGFDFVNFDAEGVSVDLCLHAIVELGWRPYCICCEVDGKADLLGRMSLNMGYRVVYENGTNMVLVKNA